MREVPNVTSDPLYDDIHRLVDRLNPTQASHMRDLIRDIVEPGWDNDVDEVSAPAVNEAGQNQAQLE